MQLGISAPQGCGKTTIVSELEKLFGRDGLRCASVSIDDFYLSHAAQQDVSAAHPANRLLKGRGNAGTHDLTLGNETLTSLRRLQCASSSCRRAAGSARWANRCSPAKHTRAQGCTCLHALG